MPAPSRRDGARWWVARHRRPLAAALAALAVWAGLAAVRGRAVPPSVGVLVASRDLPPGTRLSTGDLRRVGMPAAVVPPTAVRDTAAALGRSLAVAVPAGLPLTTASLSVGRVLPTGTVATPVRLADPGETLLLHPGDRVDVLAAGDTTSLDDPAGSTPAVGPTSVQGAASAPASGVSGEPAPPASAAAVALDVPVLSVPSGAQGLLDASDAGGLVVLATTPRQAAVLAHAAADSRLSITLHGA